MRPGAPQIIPVILPIFLILSSKTGPIARDRLRFTIKCRKGFTQENCRSLQPLRHCIPMGRFANSRAPSHGKRRLHQNRSYCERRAAWHDVPSVASQWRTRPRPHFWENAEELHPHRPGRQSAGGAFTLRSQQSPDHLPGKVAAVLLARYSIQSRRGYLSKS